jgi:hypothetical protein
MGSTERCSLPAADNEIAMRDKSDKGLFGPAYEALIARAAKNEYLQVEELRFGEVLSAVTAYHRYDFVILDSAHRRVSMTSDHPRWRGPHEGFIQGSLLSSWTSSVLVGRVAIGLSLVFSSPDFVTRDALPEIRTTPLRVVLLNGRHVLSESKKQLR